MNQPTKRKHHYVWKYYLNGWCNTDKKVFYRTKKGKIACDNATGLARENGFYKISTLNTEDIVFILNFIQISDASVRNLHMGFLEKMILQSKQIELADKTNKYELSDRIKFNTLEDIHSNIEGDAVRIIQELRSGSHYYIFLENSRDNFLSYIGHQLLRTKYMREKFIKEFSNTAESKVLADKNWWLISVIFGVNTGYSLARSFSLKKTVMLVNETGIDFVTSDNPVVNVMDNDSAVTGNPPERMDLYFPVSPNLAYMINDSDSYGEGLVDATEEMVIALNTKMLQNSHETIFGNSREIIKSTKKQKLQGCEND